MKVYLTRSENLFAFAWSMIMLLLAIFHEEGRLLWIPALILGTPVIWFILAVLNSYERAEQSIPWYEQVPLAKPPPPEERPKETYQIIWKREETD